MSQAIPELVQIADQSVYRSAPMTGEDVADHRSPDGGLALRCGEILPEAKAEIGYDVAVCPAGSTPLPRIVENFL